MMFYVHCTENLGDFLLFLPVLSGISKKYGKQTLVMKSGMRKFKDLVPLLEYQSFIDKACFIDDPEIAGKTGFYVSSWIDEKDHNGIRPIETTRYETWLKRNTSLEFEVDDEFVISVPDLGYDFSDIQFCGDRVPTPGYDSRRKVGQLAHLPGLSFLDYNDGLLVNAYKIKNGKGPFISTFTGISVLADLLSVDQLVLWGEDLRDWDNKPIEYALEKSYYRDRKSRLMYLGTYEEEMVAK